MNPELVDLWQRVLICRAFPGSYSLRSLKNEPIRELLIAMRLLDAHSKVGS